LHEKIEGGREGERERPMNDRKKIKNSKPEHSPFIWIF
jgi:hypothetical protein